MSRRSTLSRVLTAALLISTAACGPRYVTGTKVDYSDAREEVSHVVEHYRQAMESRDQNALRSLASKNYYENGSTTDDPNDDYDVLGLEKVLGELKTTVKAVKYAVDITAIEVVEDAASVDFEYKAQFLYTVGEQDRWGTSSDKNRLVMRRENGDWKIVSGM